MLLFQLLWFHKIVWNNVKTKFIKNSTTLWIYCGDYRSNFCFVYYIYIPFFVYKGQTVGKRICKVKIIQNNNQEVSLKSLVLRQGLGMIVIEGIFVSASALWHQLVSLCIHVNIVSMMMYVGFVVGGISTLMIIFTKEHRAIHDYIGNTKVVSV